MDYCEVNSSHTVGIPASLQQHGRYVGPEEAWTRMTHDRPVAGHQPLGSFQTGGARIGT